jgi:hypothetical protein
MAKIRISELRNSSILRTYAERDLIQTDPDYQRMGEVWGLEKRQLLIDTVINDFDMPKLYFHEFTNPKRLEDGTTVKFAVIDGRQRLETIWGFIEGKFSLAEDFSFFEDDRVGAAGLTYSDLGKRYPQLKTRIDSYSLPVTTVLTDDMDLIEEMFLRLNEAVPLNAAEKRNAIGGPMAEVIRAVSQHEFFYNKIPFSNQRYQHREVAAKFLLLTSTGNVGDTKKSYLDNMVRRFKNKNHYNEARLVRDRVMEILDWSSSLFVSQDPLLRTQAMTVIYFVVFKEALGKGWAENITRHMMVDFEERRRENRRAAEDDIAKANYDLLEFDRMHLQGSNDKTSIEFRSRTLINFLLDSQSSA